jgi:excisionase family DNA binding protein
MATMETQNTMQRLLNYEEVATYLGVTVPSVRNRVYRGQIPFVRVAARTVRFDPARIASWLADREGLTASACGTVGAPASSASTAVSKTANIEPARKQAKAVTRGQNFKKTTGRPGRNGQ